MRHAEPGVRPAGAPHPGRRPGRAPRAAAALGAAALGAVLALTPGCMAPQLAVLRSGLDSLRTAVDTLTVRDSVAYRVLLDTRRQITDQRDVLLSTRATAGSTTQQLFEQMERLETRLDETLRRFSEVARRRPPREPPIPTSSTTRPPRTSPRGGTVSRSRGTVISSPVSRPPTSPTTPSMASPSASSPSRSSTAPRPSTRAWAKPGRMETGSRPRSTSWRSARAAWARPTRPARRSRTWSSVSRSREKPNSPVSAWVRRAVGERVRGAAASGAALATLILVAGRPAAAAAPDSSAAAATSSTPVPGRGWAGSRGSPTACTSAPSRPRSAASCCSLRGRAGATPGPARPRATCAASITSTRSGSRPAPRATRPSRWSRPATCGP